MDEDQLKDICGLLEKAIVAFNRNDTDGLEMELIHMRNYLITETLENGWKPNFTIVRSRIEARKF